MTRRRAKKVTFEAYVAAPPTLKKYPLALRKGVVAVYKAYIIKEISGYDLLLSCL